MFKKFIVVALCLQINIASAVSNSIIEGSNETCDNCVSNLCMIKCLQKQIAEEDIMLNKFYKHLLKNLNDDDKNSLIIAERAWLTFMQSNCHFDSQHHTSGAGGTMGAVYYTDCLLTLTQHRTKYLKDVIDNKESYP